MTAEFGKSKERDDSQSSDEAWMQTVAGRAKANLSVKNIRRMFENLAMATEGAGDVESLNR